MATDIFVSLKMTVFYSSRKCHYLIFSVQFSVANPYLTLYFREQRYYYLFLNIRLDFILTCMVTQHIIRIGDVFGKLHSPCA